MSAEQTWEDMRAYNIRLEERAREAERALERAERERDNANIQHLDLLRRAESAEQERDESDAELLDVHNRAEKAERALAEIAHGNQSLGWKSDTASAIARAALRPEDTSDES